ncbi:MAG: hypothetical protein V1644_02345 [Candidatus Micrarchaeota archaeon]
MAEKKINYKRLAAQMPLYAPRPPIADEFTRWFDTNSFGKAVLFHVHDYLVRRKQHVSEDMPTVDERTAYFKEISAADKKHSRSLSVPSSDLTNPWFSFDSDPSASHPFIFAAKDSMATKTTKAYVSLSPKEITKIPQHFVELVHCLLDANVRFYAKASCLDQARSFAHNLVFYIDQKHAVKARRVLRKFLTEKKLGDGHVFASRRDVNGLSFVNETEGPDLYVNHVASSSFERVSFHTRVAARMVPHYLERIAKAHEKLGNAGEAERFRAEIRRIRAFRA